MANTSSGRFPSYGLVRGPSHSMGGVPATVENGPDVELEGGEWIIPKEVVPDYLPVLKQITQEGRDIQNAENGNSAIDALIASADLVNRSSMGMVPPKSPMYQKGGSIDSALIMKYLKEGVPLDDSLDSSRFTFALSGQDQETGMDTYSLYDLQTGQNYGEMFDVETGTKNISNKHPSLKGASLPWQELTGSIQVGPEFNPSKPLTSKSESQALFNNAQAQPLISEKSPDEIAPVEEINTDSQDPDLAALAQRIDMWNNRNRNRMDIRQLPMSFGPAPEEVGILSEDEINRNVMSLKDLTPELKQPGLKDTPKELRPTLRARVSSALKNLLEKETTADDTNIIAPQAPDRPLTNNLQMDSPEMLGDMSVNTTDDAYLESLPGIEKILNKYSENLPGIDSLINSAAIENIKQTSSEDPVAFDKNKYPIYDKKSKKAQSFRDAFRAARIEGKDVFDWDGRSYTTELKKQQGGMIKYEGGGPLHSRRMFNQRTQSDVSKPSFVGPRTDEQKEMLNDFLRKIELENLLKPQLSILGDTLDDAYYDEQAKRILNNMRKSKIKRNPGRKPMQQGGQTGFNSPVQEMMGQGMSKEQIANMISGGEGEPVSNREKNKMNIKIEDMGFMGSLQNDGRVKPHDKYRIENKNGALYLEETKVPKLSTAYLRSFGIETPLSRRQGALLDRNAVGPNSLNRNLKGLVDRVLLQRLSNEPY